MANDRPPLDSPEDQQLIRELRGVAHDAEDSAKDPGTELAITGFEIIRELHRGGQGVVYQALQKSTKRKVAIKVLLEGEHASGSARKRFEREIELVAQLKHPSIISIFDSGVTADGRQYYVMDYIRGRPLDRAVIEGKLPLRRALALFQSVCEGVQYAHQRGVLHRDLKPSNIFVDGEGHPRILDFGLAKQLSNPVETLVSATRQLVGTVAYMSPEQVAADPDGVDARTDVYSLGVILYQMLTGGFPYPVDGPWTETIRHITETPPAPPNSSRVGTDGRSGFRRLDRDLQTVVLKALAKEKERRYQSAGELARDVGHYLGDDPIEARRDSSWYVIRKVVRRKRWHLLVALSCAALAVSLLALWSRSRDLTRSEEMAIIQGNWAEGGGEDPAERIYEAFFARLADGGTTAEKRNTMFSHALDATLRTRRFYALDQRVAVIIELHRRIDFAQHGLTPLVTVSLSMNDQVFARELRFPLSSPELKFTRQTDRVAEPLRITPPTAAELVATLTFEVHWTRDVPEMIQRAPSRPELNVLDEPVWRQERTVHRRVHLFSSLPESYPTPIVDEETALRVEEGFDAARVLVDDLALIFEFSYDGTMPIAGGLRVLSPGGEDLIASSKFTPSGLPEESRFDSEVTLPKGFLDGVRDGSIQTAKVLITPKRRVALLVEDLDFYYGLPIEREVPVFLRQPDDSP